MLCQLCKITNIEYTSQLIPIKDQDLPGVNDLLINEKIYVTLYDNLLNFRDTNKKFQLDGDILKMIIEKTLMSVFLIYGIN